MSSRSKSRPTPYNVERMLKRLETNPIQIKQHYGMGQSMKDTNSSTLKNISNGIRRVLMGTKKGGKRKNTKRKTQKKRKTHKVRRNQK